MKSLPGFKFCWALFCFFVWETIVIWTQPDVTPYVFFKVKHFVSLYIFGSCNSYYGAYLPACACICGGCGGSTRRGGPRRRRRLLLLGGTTGSPRVRDDVGRTRAVLNWVRRTGTRSGRGSLRGVGAGPPGSGARWAGWAPRRQPGRLGSRRAAAAVSQPKLRWRNTSWRLRVAAAATWRPDGPPDSPTPHNETMPLPGAPVRVPLPCLGARQVDHVMSYRGN